MTKVDLTDPAIIDRLTTALEAAGVDAVEINRSNQSLQIRLARSGRQVSVGNADTPSPATLIKAPLAGEFWATDLSRPTTQGGSVNSNLAGFLRIGPILLPVNAGTSHRLRRHLVEPGTIVGFGDSIAEVEPAA